MSSKNEAIVSKAFGKQSQIFDEIYDSNSIVSYMRDLIRKEVMSGLSADSHILEVNAGTGTDAIYFAQQGYRVTAVEVSPQMVAKAKIKVQESALEERVTVINQSFDDVSNIDGQFDYLYSNFGGLNCTPDIEKVLQGLIKKLKPGGKATLTILPPITLWEKAHVLKGNFKVAKRRSHQGPSLAHIEGEYFDCWYYTPNQIKKFLKNEIHDVQVTGLCVAVPPSFMQNFPHKLPRTYKLLQHIDRAIAKLPLINAIGDYYMITFTKNGAQERP